MYLQYGASVGCIMRYSVITSDICVTSLCLSVRVKSGVKAEINQISDVAVLDLVKPHPENISIICGELIPTSLFGYYGIGYMSRHPLSRQANFILF